MVTLKEYVDKHFPGVDVERVTIRGGTPTWSVYHDTGVADYLGGMPILEKLGELPEGLRPDFHDGTTHIGTREEVAVLSRKRAGLPPLSPAKG